jgi:NDP-sugar pyrophosphorylase family protein
MKAMILAAGFGTRLFPLTVDRTKPAIPFLGRPLVGYVAEYVAKYGFKDVVVNLHHQPESVKEALGDGSRFGVKIHYTLEHPEILGTGGALENARDLLKDETFLVVNGKIVTDIDLQTALETHRRTGAIATMILKPNAKHEKFTIIETENGLVKNFGGFPKPMFADEMRNAESAEKHNPPLMYTGIQILEPEVFDYIPPNQESDIISVFYRPAIAHGAKIAAHVAEGNWYELSTIPRYLDITLAVLNGENNGITTGDNCRIEESTDVRDSILWDNVSIEAGAKVFRSILGEGVKIRSGETIENVAIVRADLVRGVEPPEKAMEGYFSGDNYVVPLVQ